MSSIRGASRRLLVGCRTTADRQARGTGLCCFRVGPKNDVSLAGEYVCENPSYLLLSPDRRVVHTVHGDGHAVSSVGMDDSGALHVLSSQDLGGRNPVHLSFDATARWVVVANHADGSLTSLPVEADGTLGPARAHLGGLSGPHQVVVDPVSEHVLVPDKGADTVWEVQIAEDGSLTVVGGIHTTQGSGPRHLVVDSDRGLLHVLEELSCTISTHAWCPGRPGHREAVGRVSTLQPGLVASQWRASEILWSPSRTRLFAGNRSGAGDSTPGGPDDDTIVEYAVHPFSGLPGSPRWHSSHGIRPRHFSVDEVNHAQGHEVLLTVANERSDTIATLRRDSDGEFTPTADPIRTGSPTCVVWVDE